MELLFALAGVRGSSAKIVIYNSNVIVIYMVDEKFHQKSYIYIKLKVKEAPGM